MVALPRPGRSKRKYENVWACLMHMTTNLMHSTGVPDPASSGSWVGTSHGGDWAMGEHSVAQRGFLLWGLVRASMKLRQLLWCIKLI